MRRAGLATDMPRLRSRRCCCSAWPRRFGSGGSDTWAIPPDPMPRYARQLLASPDWRRLGL